MTKIRNGKYRSRTGQWLESILKKSKQSSAQSQFSALTEHHFADIGISRSRAEFGVVR
jgi:hypothetical protein